MQACVAEVALGHVEIALFGIESEALDISVGDADVEAVGRLFLSGHPADGVIFAMFAGAGAGVEVDFVIIAFEVLGAGFGQGEHATAIRCGAKLFPEFAIRSLRVIVIACKNENRLAFEFPENFHSPLDLRLCDGDFVEEIAGDHDEVGVALVGGGDHSFERGEASFDQAFLGGFRILVEGKADVVVGGVENAEAHGAGREQVWR